MNNNKHSLKNSTITEAKNNWPATLYVEGKDQFRGWFNSSLITSIILSNQAPYQQVLSHGFVVDEKGHKMSKSLGNVIDPEEIIQKFGADVLRLWVISSDFTKEVKISIPILEKVQESYQKIRNTLRFLLGNLANVPPELKNEKLLEKKLDLVDCYILQQLKKLVEKSNKQYKEYNFNPIYSSLVSFCTNDLSSFYFEISKDSLYCDHLYSQRRKQIITTLYYLLQGLLKVIVPILPFLAEEVYQNIPLHSDLAGQQVSIQLESYSPTLPLLPDNEKEIELITDFFLPLRQEVYQTLEKARQEKIINTNSQAHLAIHLKEKNSRDYSKLNLEELLLVAKVVISEKKESNEQMDKSPSSYVYQEYNLWWIKVIKTEKEKCIRCWNYRDLAKGVCQRCEKALSQN